MLDFNSYSLFVQILVSSFHCPMKTPKTHVLFVENIERMPVGSPHNIRCKAHKMRWIVAGGYLLPSFFLSSIVNKDSHFARLSASSVCKMSIGHLSLQRLLRSVIHSVRARRAHWSFFCVFLGTTPFDVSRLQGFRSGRVSKPLRTFTVALSLRPSKLCATTSAIAANKKLNGSIVKWITS